MRILFIGPPGAGKGTQAVRICNKHNIPQIATGDILRKAVSKQTEMGLQAKSFMDKGALVPDEVVIGIVQERLTSTDVQNGYILDGFPRTVKQANVLKNMLQDLGQSINVALCIEVPDQNLIERILQRAKEQNRLDDTKDVVVARIQNYNKETFPLLDFYETEGILKKINGLGTVEEVSLRIEVALSSVL